MKRFGFTMVELVFVIVILGILAAIAVPRLAASRADAQIAKAKSDIAAIRSSIATKRAQNIMSGDATFPNLEADGDDSTLFDGVLDYPIVVPSATDWTKQSDVEYTVTIDGQDTIFQYDINTGKFVCEQGVGMCDMLTQ